jgi:15-cis-phytoene synthase
MLPRALADEARGVMRRHAKSFVWAARFLAPSTRADTTLLYAFARIADDLADEPGLGPLDQRLAALAALKAELLEPRGADAPARSVAGAVAQLRRRHALPASLFECFLDSLRDDAQPRGLRTEQELLAFAYGVAGTVGLMMRPMLGAPPAADPHALALGIAMQLTNVARDVVEDAARARCYVPSSYGVACDEMRQPADAAARLRAFAAITRVLALAKDFYAFGERGLPLIPAPNRRAVRIALVLYRGIGRKIMKRGADRYWQGRTHLGALAKLWLTAPLLLGERRPRAVVAARPDMSPPGRHGPRRGPFSASGEYRSAQHEGTPMTWADALPAMPPLPGVPG